jgi:uncharacterized protein (TIGR03118 family)
MHGFLVRLAALAAIVAAALTAAAPLKAVPPDDRYTVTGIVSNLATLAPHVDPNLQNGWGLAASATSPWWVADNDTDKATLYTAAGAINPLVVGVDGGPTGTVFGGMAGQFQVATATSPTLGPASFIFASQDGKIRAWRSGASALVTADRSAFGSSYFGLTIAGSGSAARLYAADFKNRAVDVFDGTWTLVTAPGAFTEPHLPSDYGPFGIQAIGNRIFVAFAQQETPGGDEVHAPGAGIVDAFDLDGHFLSRVASHGGMNAPWGLAMAPASGFGPFSGDLLIGNFGDGVIQAFRELPDGSWDHEGVIRDEHRLKVSIDGLWSLQFGHGSTNNGPASTLFFTAGPNDETDGVFGSITLAPTPGGAERSAPSAEPHSRSAHGVTEPQWAARPSERRQRA